MKLREDILFAYIKNEADENKVARLFYGDMAEVIYASKRTVNRLLKKFVSDGVLEVVERPVSKNRPGTYRIL